MKPIFASIIAVSLLSGCETFFAHYNMSESRLEQIAKANAVTNICLAHGSINSNMAFALNSTSAQLLDIVVFDRDFYRSRYEVHTAMLRQTFEANNSIIQQSCLGFERVFPDFIAELVQDYISISNKLNSMRAQERQQMTAMLNDYRSNWNQQTYENTVAMYGPPKVSFLDSKPEMVNYLVNTSKGQIQCRVTAKQYVFCM
jgi:hypothetical protein